MKRVYVYESRTGALAHGPLRMAENEVVGTDGEWYVPESTLQRERERWEAELAKRVLAELTSDSGLLDGELGEAIADESGSYGLEFTSPEQVAEGFANWLRSVPAALPTEEES